MSDSTRTSMLVRVTHVQKAAVVAAAEAQNLSANEFCRRALAAAVKDSALVATSEGGSRVSPEQEKGASLSPASPRARTAPPAAGPTAITPRAKPSRAAKAGVRPQPKQGKR